MVKKIIAGVLVVAIVVLACFKLFYKGDTTSKKLEAIGENLTSYHMEANMEINNSEDIRKFYVTVDYLKQDEDYFRISLLDKDINQEQIMLKNKNGVYVLTPKLNQVYEFKGNYPLNSPKPYLYHSMMEEIKNKNYEAKKMNDGYLLTINSSYKNHPNWVKEEIKLSSDLKPVWVNIYDKDNNLLVAINYTKVEFNPTLNVSYFDVKSNMEEAKENVSSSNLPLDELPLIPNVDSVTARLKEQTEATVNGEKIYILTYEGSKEFTMTQRVLAENEEMSSLLVSGELVTMYSGVGYSFDKKLVYIQDNMEYQIYSDTLTVTEMLEIITSMSYEIVK